MSETGSSSGQKELPQILAPTPVQENPEELLDDKDMNVRDPLIPVCDLHLAIKNVLELSARGPDIMNICQSRLVSAVVPQVHNFPEVVEWCAKGYLSERKAVVSSDGTRVVISITPEAIASMLRFPQEAPTTEWEEDKMAALYLVQTPEARQEFLMSILNEKELLATPPYPIQNFTAAAIMTMSMIAQVLGLDTAFLVTESLLGALLFLSGAEEAGGERRIDFCKQISEDIDLGLQNFHLSKTFRFQSYLIHLFLHQQFTFMGHLHLDLVGKDHQVKPTMDWCPKIRANPENTHLWWYINNFLPLLYTLIYQPPPRVIPEMFQELQTTPVLATGDWFLYEDHTIIRVYGFEGRPYRLPSFVTPRIFALEFIRQKMASDDLHFSGGRFARTFRIPTGLGPFVVKSRQAYKTIEKMMEKLNFPSMGPWKYDPNGIIFKLKNPAGDITAGGNPYHDPQPVIEKLANQISFLGTKAKLAAVEQGLVIKERQPGGDLTDEVPLETRSKTEEDLEKMMQIFPDIHSGGQRQELFRLQAPEEAASTSGTQALVSMESIYESIRASGRDYQKKTEEPLPESFPDSRLLSAFNMESGQLRMALLQSTKPRGEVATSEADYKATEVRIDMTQIHFKDMIQLHQQSSNILYRDLKLQHTTTNKLRKSLESVAAQYRIEKSAIQAKNVKIRSLEKALLDLSEDPKNVKHSQNLLQEKDKEIALLKKKLKIPGTHPTGIEEVNAVLKEKEAVTQKLIEAEERIHKYLAQNAYLSGKLESLSTERILSSTERVTAEAQEVTTEKALAVQLQGKLTEAEMALVDLREEQRRLRHHVEEQDKHIANLEAELEERSETARGLETLKDARVRVWDDIWDLIVKNWEQLSQYQELHEQVIAAHHKLRQLDKELEGKADIAEEVLVALNDLPKTQLEALGIHDRIAQLRNVHRVLEKSALIEKTRSLAKVLGNQCHDYRARFDKCVRLGLPALFSATGENYEEVVYLLRIQVVMKDNSVFDKLPKYVGGKDIKVILKNCFDILYSLKLAFKSKNSPQYARGAEISLAAATAEEYRYPLKKEWNLLLACLKAHKQKMVDPLAEMTPQQGESSQGQEQTVSKTALTQQKLVTLPTTVVQTTPVSPLPPLPPTQSTEPQQAVRSPQPTIRFFSSTLQAQSSQPASQQQPSTASQQPRKRAQPRKQDTSQSEKAPSEEPNPPKRAKK